MADANFVLARGFDCAAAVTKRRFVKVSAADVVTPVTAASDVVVGVSRYDCTAADILRGKGATVDMMGIAEVEASAAITINTLVGISANGRLAASGAGVRTVGVALTAASTAGDTVTVLLMVPSVLGVGA
jgi:hypothetical protein